MKRIDRLKRKQRKLKEKIKALEMDERLKKIRKGDEDLIEW